MNYFHFPPFSIRLLLCVFRTSIEYSPVIAFHKRAWRRGIVWELSSSNCYHSILFIDTLQITDVHQNLIQKCPTEFIGTIAPFAKVHLSQIKPNARMRALDICNELDQIVMNKELIAYVIDRRDNGEPEVKLYESERAKRPIYISLIKQNFYKKFPNAKDSAHTS